MIPAMAAALALVGAPAAAAEFDPERIARGAALAAIGNCRACHTADNGRSFAGGRPLETPFGTLYSTNITPEAATGIGRWTLADFRRALHEGIDRRGHRLYPAFPYDHFTRVTDDDVEALYAFIMTRAPVDARPPPNRLIFPANLRAFLALWQTLYFRPGRFVADPAHDATWNRGAYLVEGLGHCGACHTPRNFAGAEETRNRFEGGDAEGWHAPGLLENAPGPLPWTADMLFRYLQRGFAPDHGFAAGPMREVVDDLSGVPEEDVRAIAVYLAGTGAPAGNGSAIAAARARDFDAAGRAPNPAGNPVGMPGDRGHAIFAGICATCHYAGEALPARKPISLALATSVNAKEPSDVLNIVVKGIHPRPGEVGPIMPPFGDALTDDDIVAVVRYVRAHFSDRPAWTNVDATLKTIRGG